MIAMFALAAAAPPLPIGRADANAAFRAGGFVWRGRAWRSDCEDAGNPSYSPGRLMRVADLNRDGLPEAVIGESSALCFGNTGSRFTLVSKQRDGRWRRIARNTGYPRFLESRGVGGWPDLEVGLPGLCTPVLRWNGSEYRLHRFSRADAPHCRLPRGR